MSITFKSAHRNQLKFSIYINRVLSEVDRKFDPPRGKRTYIEDGKCVCVCVFLARKTDCYLIPVCWLGCACGDHKHLTQTASKRVVLSSMCWLCIYPWVNPNLRMWFLIHAKNTTPTLR